MKDVTVKGYGLLMDGAPLCVYSTDFDYSHSREYFALSKDEGKLYIVDQHAARYYLTYRGAVVDNYDWYPKYAPEDSNKLLDRAALCHIQVSMRRGDMFSLKVSTCPLDRAETIEPYRIFPDDSLIDTKSGPTSDTIIKLMKYTPSDLGGEYVDRHGYCIDTYLGGSDVIINYIKDARTDSTSNTLASCKRYIDDAEVTKSHCHLFRRERKYPMFYDTFIIGPILSNTFPQGDQYE